MMPLKSESQLTSIRTQARDKMGCVWNVAKPEAFNILTIDEENMEINILYHHSIVLVVTEWSPCCLFL